MKFWILSVLLLFTSKSYSQNWTQTNGPNGGFIVKMIVDSSDNYYAGTDQSGIYRSTNQGASWEEYNQGFTENLSIIKNMACISDTEILASEAWTFKQNCRFDPKTGTWKDVFLKSLPFVFHSIYKTKQNTILIGNSSLLRSENDSYDTLFRSDSGIVQDDIISITGSSDGEVYLSTTLGLYRSLDDGKSWKRILSKIFNGGVLLTSLLVKRSADQKNEVYSGSWAGLLRTTNDGVSWDTLLLNGHVSDVGTVGSRIFAAVQYQGVYFSSDNGLSWKLINQGLTSFSSVPSFAITRNNTVLADTYGGGVYSLNYGDSVWHHISKGLTHISVDCLAIEGKDTLYAGTVFGGINISTDQGATWSQSTSGIEYANILSLMITKANNLYAGTQGGVYVSFDHSLSWHKVKGLNSSVNQMILSDKDIIYIFVSDSSYYLKVGDSIAYKINESMRSPNITSVTKTSDGNLYAFGTWEYQAYPGFYTTTQGVLLSPGDGTAFTSISTSPFLYDQGLIGSLGNLLFFFSGGLLRESNDGMFWSSGSTVGFNPTAMLVGNNNRLYLGTGGILISLDSVKSWTAINSGLTNGTVNSIARDSSDILYIGSGDAIARSKGGGVYRSTAPGYSLSVKSPRVVEQNDRSKFILTSLNKTVRLQGDDVTSMRIFNLTGVEVGSFSTFIVDQNREINVYDLLETDGFYCLLISYRSGITNKICVIRD